MDWVLLETILRCLSYIVGMVVASITATKTLGDIKDRKEKKEKEKKRLANKTKRKRK
ncbi:hypothetical protein COE50_22340 [Bacillus anthracis]|nr:hypothetical protein COE50_22340 [Bacillus anthracis]